MTQHMRAAGVGAFALLTASALVLSGCSSSGTPTTTDAKEFTVFAPVTEVGESPYKALVEAFNEANPEYTATLEEAGGDAYAENLRTKLQAGSAADVFYVVPGRGQGNAALPLAEGGYLAPLDDTNAASTVPEGSDALFYLDDKLYAQGLDLAVVGVVANEALMEADGVTYPESYEELLDACAAATAKGHSFFVLAGSMAPNAGLAAQTIAGDLVYAGDPDWNTKRQNDEVTFADTEGWVDTLDRFTEMNDAGCFQEGAEGGTFDTITNNLVGAQSYAGFVPSGAAFGLGGAAPDARFVVHPFPSDDAADTVISASVNNALAINAKTEALTGAKLFLDFASEVENAANYAGVSGNIQIVGADFEALPPQYAGAVPLLIAGSTYALPNQGWGSAEVYSALGVGIQGILTGQATTDQVLADMDSAW